MPLDPCDALQPQLPARENCKRSTTAEELIVSRLQQETECTLRSFEQEAQRVCLKIFHESLYQDTQRAQRRYDDNIDMIYSGLQQPPSNRGPLRQLDAAPELGDVAKVHDVFPVKPVELVHNIQGLPQQQQQQQQTLLQTFEIPAADLLQTFEILAADLSQISDLSTLQTITLDSDDKRSIRSDRSYVSEIEVTRAAPDSPLLGIHVSWGHVLKHNRLCMLFSRTTILFATRHAVRLSSVMVLSTHITAHWNKSYIRHWKKT
jgi:hypothetical protein